LLRKLPSWILAVEASNGMLCLGGAVHEANLIAGGRLISIDCFSIPDPVGTGPLGPDKTQHRGGPVDALY
jgi:hypothetical protein